jgi:hypothetical protein
MVSTFQTCASPVFNTTPARIPPAVAGAAFDPSPVEAIRASG